ncbi:uncharacterized protein LY79DRAFT_336322 [Colletotrichum navitas]|uniref:Uncharacterized protein n=1 Tax=Colletotrichum navitas TaxID=681940 RepID=A0AAD8PT89_9PEZI|nr:uncharacterized protein LY79DRAFT_336322 [Colletotrichum navitas]KAK1579674.1 hypothetical protein LY79DRAFT_336322 [Colletotrichum navitas]
MMMPTRLTRAFHSPFQLVLRQACWLLQSTLAGGTGSRAARLLSSKGPQTLTLIQCHDNAVRSPPKHLQVSGLFGQAVPFPGKRIPSRAPPIGRDRYTAAFPKMTSPNDAALECIDAAETKHMGI